MNALNAYDVIVIGGGPAGSTAASLLAKSGLRVAIFEKRAFPRFHIGESLLPASLPIFKELGVAEKIKELFIKKPGGKWYYGNRPLMSNFAKGPEDTSFKDNPYSYMVRRAEFDEVLLNHSISFGVKVFQNHLVTDIIKDNEKIIGVVVTDEKHKSHEIKCNMVFDCSGFSGVIAQKLKLRKANRLKRMAVFGHYEVKVLNPDVANGWFVGQMLYNGWIWLIPLKENLLSIGVVIPIEKYNKAKISPQEFLEDYIHNTPVSKNGIASNFKLKGKIHLYGNLGYTTSQAYGEGWVLVGDAAFFIDPCYSSGVHLALSSAKEAANLYIEHLKTGKSQVILFQQYEKILRRDEKLVLRFVDSFYMASRNSVLRWLIPFCTTESLNRKFVAVTGGDFAKKPFMINWLYFLSKIISILLPFSNKEYQVSGTSKMKKKSEYLNTKEVSDF